MRLMTHDRSKINYAFRLQSGKNLRLFSPDVKDMPGYFDHKVSS